MDHARILDREADGLLLIAPLAPAADARPRLLALYRDQLTALPESERDMFLTARAMATRGMRLLRLQPQAIPGHPEVAWPSGMVGAMSHDGGQVAVWLRRSGSETLGLDLQAIRPDAQAGLLSGTELHLLAQQPGLARLRPEEQQAGAISAKQALSRGLALQLGVPVSPADLEIRASARSGINLRLMDAALHGLRVDSDFRVELRVMPGLVLTRVAVGTLSPLRPC
ncbi:hypothetical protein [Paracoccus onubensis]|uniref:4'-phosphopantetheinyl transferase N-terminal domain-containing protein n=1 Tax=Paracoccus onubensis TaxID=1675788 RepID=A0A418T093_9RHOB|nr:hypothetical protein [Paracoccus onubensis]RJE86641.1 hypothetical protein D3P04_08015 [Paracoccus onubensis]